MQWLRLLHPGLCLQPESLCRPRVLAGRHRGGAEDRADLRDVGDRGRLALGRDPQGANIALLQTRYGDPSDREAEPAEFMWNELWTSDAEPARDFYQGVFGYQRRTAELENVDLYA